MIMDYLRKQNRPYSATDISANLHNAVTKTNAAKVLKDLSDKGDLKVAVSGEVFTCIQSDNCKADGHEWKGKQMVYHIPQVRPTSKRMCRELELTLHRTQKTLRLPKL